MYYLVYKITNKINGKFYIGAHRTLDKTDCYMGSGILIEKAIRKYGIENFEKEILFECETPEEMFQKERENTIIDSDISYNIVLGGVSPFNNSPEHYEWSILGQKTFQEKRIADKEFDLAWRKSLSNRSKRAWPRRKEKLTFKNRKHKQSSKDAIGLANSKMIGEKNAQYGTFWIKNDVTKRNKKLKKHEIIPEGWLRGRNMQYTMTQIPDPAENHRAGYHKDKLQYVMEWVRRHPDSTMTSGEGKILLDEIDRLQDVIDEHNAWDLDVNG